VVFSSLELQVYIFKAILMQTGQDVNILGVPFLDIASSLANPYFLENKEATYYIQIFF
jgi:hypothetical protein